MEKFIDRLIREFESGALGRREFCQMLGIAAAITAAGGPEANAAPAGSTFKALGVNHISYLCPDYTKARDFYASMFGMQVVNDKGKGRANLAFGPAPDKGGNFLVVHNPGANPPKPSEAVIDHIAYTISNWDEAKVRGALKAKGLRQAHGARRQPACLRSVRLRRPVRQCGPRKRVPARGIRRKTMESFYATKIDEFAKGKISRRALLETLTVAVTTTAATVATGAANAAASDPALKVALVNHISYNCPDFKKGADWYSKVFNLEQIGTTKIDTALPFGKKGEKPFGVTANDVPLTSIIVRTRDLNAPPQGGGEAAPQEPGPDRAHGLYGRRFRPRKSEGHAEDARRRECARRRAVQPAYDRCVRL